MSEDKDLLARISQLAGKHYTGFEKLKLTIIGRINIHKTHTHSDLPHQPGPIRPSTAPTFNQETGHAGTGSWKPARVAPYTRIEHRGRINNPRRHRTLVLNSTGQRKPSARAGQQPAPVVAARSMVPEDTAPAIESAPPPTSWVSKRDRHMQLISSTIYDKDTENRDKATRESKRQNAFQAQHIEKAKIQRHLQALSHGQPSDSSSVAPTAHKVYINGLSFIVKNGGSKLLRVQGISDAAHSTPKEANVGGVTFYRSKNGNLYRSGIVTAKKAGQIRKRAANAAGTINPAVPSTESEHDLTSEEEEFDAIDSEDVDSDGLEGYMMDISDDHDAQSLSQQQDYIQL